MGVTPDRFEELVTQLKWRTFAEGDGEALYELGVEDDEPTAWTIRRLPSRSSFAENGERHRLRCSVAHERGRATGNGARRA